MNMISNRSGLDREPTRASKMHTSFWQGTVMDWRAKVTDTQKDVVRRTM
jgi:hypothetical protein